MKWHSLHACLVACVALLVVDAGCSPDTEIVDQYTPPTIRVPDCKSPSVTTCQYPST